VPSRVGGNIRNRQERFRWFFDKKKPKFNTVFFYSKKYAFNFDFSCSFKERRFTAIGNWWSLAGSNR
ncbi:hypothetical protein M3P05_20755, partial [Sansalvadorimonas sp. 2012CJ34-2]